jgi:hypothetical protein
MLRGAVATTPWREGGPKVRLYDWSLYEGSQPASANVAGLFNANVEADLQVRLNGAILNPESRRAS